MASEENLAERFERMRDVRLPIANADDFGMCHTGNAAIAEKLARGADTPAIIVPCPWFEHAVKLARAFPATDLGVHITHASEWRLRGDLGMDLMGDRQMCDLQRRQSPC